MGVVYACSGSCHGVVTEEMQKSGKMTCGAESCEKHGQPLEKRTQCESCATDTAKDGNAHVCENCTA